MNFFNSFFKSKKTDIFSEFLYHVKQGNSSMQRYIDDGIDVSRENNKAFKLALESKREKIILPIIRSDRFVPDEDTIELFIQYLKGLRYPIFVVDFLSSIKDYSTMVELVERLNTSNIENIFNDLNDNVYDSKKVNLLLLVLSEHERFVNFLTLENKRFFNETYYPGLFDISLKKIVKAKLFPLIYNYDSKSQKVCDLFKPLDKKELEYVANIYNIDKKLSRAKICYELGTILQSYIKNKEENISKCNNNETSIGGDSVKDIPSRRFFTYTQNDKVYCEDLEEFYGYIKSGGSKNPFTGVKLADDIIEYINVEYEKFKKDIFEKYTEANTGLTYSAHLANLLTKLHYPRNDDWYKALSAEEVINFIKSFPGITTRLTDKSIRTLDEIRQIGIQELVKFIEDDSISPDKNTKKILVTQSWNGDI